MFYGYVIHPNLYFETSVDHQEVDFCFIFYFIVVDIYLHARGKCAPIYSWARIFKSYSLAIDNDNNSYNTTQ